MLCDYDDYDQETLEELEDTFEQLNGGECPRCQSTGCDYCLMTEEL